MAKKVQNRNKGKRVFWEHNIKNWKKSGLSQAEYCRRNSLKARSFTYWKGRLKTKSQSISIVPVPFQTTPLIKIEQKSQLKLVVGNGLEIEIGDNFKSATLLRIVKTLKSI